MSKPSSSLPTITSDIPRDLRIFLDRLRGVLDGAGTRAVMTRADLEAFGLIDKKGEPILDGPALATPPVVTNLSAAGAFSNVILTWDNISYPNHAYTEVWASVTYDTLLPDTDPAYVVPASLDNLSTATLLDTAGGSVTTDQIGSGKGKYYWARNVNTQGATGPFNAVSGVLATTAPDVTFLLTTLTDSITQGQLATALSDEIDLVALLETYTGYVSSYTGANLVTRIGSVDTSVVSINSSVTALNSSVSTIDSELTTLNTNVANIQTAIADLVSGSTSVFVQASAPTGTIAEFSRWYDSDDNNKVYAYIDQGSGLAWVALDDPRVAANEVAVTALDAEVFNANGTSRLATGAALSTLDTTVIAIGSTIVAIQTDITALEGEVFNANGSARLATGAAVTTLSNTVASQGTLITSTQADVTALEGEVFNGDGTARLATGAALSTLSNTVASDGLTIAAIQTDVTALEGEVFSADGSARLATGAAVTSLTNTVTTQGSNIGTLQTDVTTL